jgi:predicted small lipoprotein YifL
MFRAGIALTVAFTLAACGMKGDLYLPAETPAENAALPVPAETDQADKGERRTIPATPDSALSR